MSNNTRTFASTGPDDDDKTITSASSDLLISPSSFNHGTLFSKQQKFSNNKFDFNSHGSTTNVNSQQQHRPRRNNNYNNGLRNNMGTKKKQSTAIINNGLPPSPPSTPSYSPSPTTTTINSKTTKKPSRPRRRRNNHSSGSTNTNNILRNTNTASPMSPSAASICSLASIASSSSSSGLSSGASSMRTLNDPDISIISNCINNNGNHPHPDETEIHSNSVVIKSSSSSAASSAGFCDMTSNDDDVEEDEDEEDLLHLHLMHEKRTMAKTKATNSSLLINNGGGCCSNFFDPIFFDSYSIDKIQNNALFSRQWSLPNGFHNYHSEMSKSNNKNSNNSYNNNKKHNNNHRRQNQNNGGPSSATTTPNNNYPNLSNPAVQQFYNEQRQFYRKIYDQQFAALTAIKLATTTSATANIAKATASATIDGTKTLPINNKLERQLSEQQPKSTTTKINGRGGNGGGDGYIPHQHLGLPPIPPPPASTATPWLYQGYPIQLPETIPPSPCEEEFLNILKAYEITKNSNRPQNLNILKIKKALNNISLMNSKDNNNSMPIISPTTITSSSLELSKNNPKIITSYQKSKKSSLLFVEPNCLAAREDFHKQIRDRLLLATSEKRSDSSISSTPVKKLPKELSSNFTCSLSNAAAIAGVATPPPPLPQGVLSEDQSIFLQSLPLRRAANSTSSEPPPATSYASAIISSLTTTKVKEMPVPLNALTLPPLVQQSLSSTVCENRTPTSSRRHGNVTSTPKSSAKKNSRKDGRDNRLLSSTSTSSTKRNNVKEFCMKENDFPPISSSSTSCISKDLKGESGYQSEFSTRCSTADGETIGSTSSDSNGHRNYSDVVAQGSKSCHALEEANNIFVSTSTEDEAVPVPENISSMDVLSEHICSYYEKVTQTEKTLLKKLRLRDMLYYSLQPYFPVCGLYVVGSSLNGFGNENSDMDLCLVITNRDLDQRTDAVNILKTVVQVLSALPVVQEQKLIEAKVPILRIKFSGPYSNITVDLNANNSVAIKNTHLLFYYAFFDWRLRPLVAIVKEWAKRCNINDASRSSFTSYSLVLMVIHYLQVGFKDPVLPSLQQIFPRRFNARNDVRVLNVSIPLDPMPPSCSFKPNTSVSLAELLLGFFHYYAHVYNYEKNAISVRLGRSTERQEVIKNRLQWSPICIEEPFTHMNTAHSIYDERVFEAIKVKFREAHDILEKTFDLNKLLNIHPSTSVSPSTMQSEIMSKLQLSDD